jgi:hypothetical protein
MNRTLARLSLTVIVVLMMNLLGHAAPVFAANPSANLDQCANDPFPSPSSDGCNSTANQWVNGNLGASKAVYFEGDSIPYRLRFGNLPLTSHTVVIEWDTTKSGKHALDYIDDFNESVLDANPCLGVTPCNPMVFDTEPIPADPQVTVAGVTPLPGDFRLYGGTITAVSAYSYPNGTGFTGDKSARISITFTASQANPVLAWGGHISTRLDWGALGSAVAIPGSPYHTRLISLDGAGGNQDRSLSADAVVFPGSITIIKDAVPNDAQDFSFSSTGGLSPATFSLDDDVDPMLSNMQLFSMITNFTTYTVTEASVTNWTLSFNNPVCTVSSPNGGTQSGNVGTRTVTINLKEGENITCTFVNTRNVSSPTIATQVKNNADGSNIANGASVAIGTVAFDTSSLSGATSDAGGTVTYYVEKGDNQCTTDGATSLGTVNVTNGSIPDSSTYTFGSAGTYYFWAVYSGDSFNNGATSGCDTEIVVVNANAPTIATQVKNNADGSNIANGASVAIGTVAYDTSSLSGATSDAGGTVSYYIEKGDNQCTTDGATSLGTVSVTNGSVPDSNTYTFGSAGTYYFWAVYSGDSNNTGAMSGCDTEIVVVNANAPTITTQVKNNADGSNIANGASVAIGTVAYDTSSLSGATSDAGGTVTYYVEKGDDQCTTDGATSLGTVNVTNGSIPDSSTYTFGSAGTYYFWAVYSGDGNNTGDTSGCDTEIVVVNQNQAALSTAQNLIPNDDATLSGVTSDAGGTITFNLYDPGDITCSGSPAYTETVNVSGNGTYSTTNSTFVASTEGTWRWIVSYTGDSNNAGATSTCGTEQFTIDN